VIRQFLTLSAGEGAARGLHSLAFLVLARGVGPQALGEFGVAQAMASYGLLAVQRGLDLPAMLRVTREPGVAGALRSAMVRLRLPVFVVLLVGVFVWGNWLERAMAGMWLAGSLQMRWLLLARQKGRAVVVAAVIASSVFLGASVAGLPLVWVAASLSVGELLGAWWLWREAGSDLVSGARLDGALQREAWPFLASLLLGNLLYNADVFVLGALRDSVEVGLYVAAFRLITVISPILGALQNSSLPLFGKLYPDGAAAGELAFRVWSGSVLVSVGLALVLALTAGVLVPLLYGEGFRAAVPLVPVLAAVLPVQVTRMVYRQALLAFKGEWRDLEHLSLSVGLNLTLNFVLVPRYGAMGCAVSTFCAESCFAFLTWRTWRRLACA
jgi:O-antigen/teichoic acid export membrane protein